jgi:hypothetical protein
MAAVEDVAVLLSLLFMDRVVEPSKPKSSYFVFFMSEFDVIIGRRIAAFASCDIPFRALRKIGCGFVLCAASFGAARFLFCHCFI